MDFNRIGLVQMKLGWTWPIWLIGPAHRLTSPGSTTPGSPLASLPHPTNPNPNRSPRSRDSESPAALSHDFGEPRRQLLTHVGQSVHRPGLRHLTEGNLLPRPRSPPPSPSRPQ
jgi:hypothetical protein